MSRACCFTGHRALPPQTDDAYFSLQDALEGAIVKALMEYGCTTFYAGGAVGFDLLASELVLTRKARHPSIELILCCPYAGHDAGFSPRDRARWESVKTRADRTLYLTDRYTPSCYYHRNRYMVEHSDLLIGYIRDPNSGSRQTWSLAKERGLDIILL